MKVRVNNIWAEITVHPEGWILMVLEITPGYKVSLALSPNTAKEMAIALVDAAIESEGWPKS
jgi:hypothetical protein